MSKPATLNLTVVYTDGTEEKYEAGIHISEKTNLLHIWPRGGGSCIKVPMANVKKIVIDD